MKNFVLVVISAIVLTVFIALNYLLWDRETRMKSFENFKDSQNVNIDSLKRQLDAITKENENLKEKNNEISENVKYLEDGKNKLNIEKDSLRKKLQEANDIITAVESKIDMKPVELIVKRWVDGINGRQPEVAYNMQYKNIFSTSSAISMDEFRNVYSKGVASIRLKSVKPYQGKTPEDMSGQLLFVVSLEVKKDIGAEPGFFSDGINDKIFVLKLDQKSNAWVIVDVISSV
ncbi:MAG TPA: hypothetical protein VF941_18080 [Clostridia bacterium]